MKNDTYSELLKWVEKKALTLGVTEIKTRLSYGKGIEITKRDSKLETIKESVEAQLSVDIFYKNRYSTHQTNNLNKDKIEKFLTNAIDMTQYLSEDENRRLADPEYYKNRYDQDLDLMDKQLKNASIETKMEYTDILTEAAYDTKEPIISVTADYGDYYSLSLQRHSNGFFGKMERTTTGMGASISMEEAGGKKPEGWKYISARHASDLWTPEKIAIEAVKKTSQKMGSSKIKSGKMDMIVENTTVGRLLGPVYNALRGGNLFNERSFLKNKKGELIASDKLNIMDEPHIQRATGSRYYDGDGFSSKTFPLIEKGVLSNYYIGNYYSKKLNMTPTSGSRSNAILIPGKISLDDMIKSVKKGVLVQSFIGGNANGTTGDFSYGVIGMYIENGKIIKPVSEINVSGNYSNILNQIVNTGSDLYTFSSFRVPSLHFENIDFAGL